MNDGTHMIVSGFSLRMVSHCSSGMPFPTRMTLAPSSRMPRK